ARWSIEVAAGASIGGSLTADDARYRVGEGFLASASASFAILDGQGSAPFLLASLSFAGSGAPTSLEGAAEGTSGASLYAFDARVGLMVGKTFWNALSPYLAARAFGGPVLWTIDGEDATGTDRYHVQAAVGVLATALRRLDVFVEIAPLGERAVA